MTARSSSTDYSTLLDIGPFPGCIDPWAEDGHYFQQIHAEIISLLARQMKPLLKQKGYKIGREASLQITEGREPDIFIQRAMAMPVSQGLANYNLAAAEVLAKPGIQIDAEVTLQALHIHHGNSLVTVVELISPGNKTKPEVVMEYRARRERLIEHNVNVVEIDPTRSVKHLINDPIVKDYPYHVAVFLPGSSPYFIGMEFGKPLDRVAIPLRGEVVAVELQDAYQDAYNLYSIGGQILEQGHYDEQHLPFPSLLTADQRTEALEAVARWKARLQELHTPSN